MEKPIHRYHCRGPKLHSYVSGPEPDWIQVAIALGVKGPIKSSMISELKQKIFVRASEGVDDRLPCGYEMTSIIGRLPHDGEEHFAECPRCGTRTGVIHRAR